MQYMSPMVHMTQSVVTQQMRGRTHSVVTPHTYMNNVAFVDGSEYNGYIDTVTRAADGKGKRTFAEGSEYDGDWRQGIMEGTGTMKFGVSCPSLAFYKGGWKGNKFHGKGTLWYRHEHIPNIPTQYNGEFKFGQMDGQGFRAAPHGETYDGNWKENKRHGVGRQKWSNGNCYVGAWRDDKRHGYGKYTGADGKSMNGDWQDDKYQGQGTGMPSQDAKDLGGSTDGIGQKHGDSANTEKEFENPYHA